ncbi:nucleoside-diphosphate-sugar epimerase [Phenylobacterium haematophilum]|uniref:Nucleoside-diphosphate-sugar epimerase n=1 Tax=Phenylobacterium haematophilum TaxID=98513 RepID=A0A839ZUJ4_9CAUL|nr:NAD-dependent epimerase/dehydratase family protein [Phenylobacterium haematophilum]MBB3890135.1 nucleoside-diphosphate-sugar epimerase [Phenylobacterium haematophilum]
MTQRVLVTGAAGLVGQNLIAQLARTGEFELVAVDKHPQNTSVLKRLHPQLQIITADLAEPGNWEEVAAGCDAVVMLQAQIGGLDPEAFRRNNIVATDRVLAAAGRGARPYVAHVSSSVVNSQARDLYTESKKAQEAIVAECGLPHVILRPTLMFGWFDRKHLGWLARFMRRAPVFPIPGDGRYLRQPLYAGDFASIIAVCLRERREGTFNISGQERIDYIDLIRQIRDIDGSRTPIVRIPVWLFRFLLKTYAIFDRNPPFTTAQLKALRTPDVFEVIDWPGIFGVRATPLREALSATLKDPAYADVELTF